MESLPLLDKSIKTNSLLIIPNGGTHDSGYETMTYVITDIETQEQYKTHGGSDALSFADALGWHIDCVPEYHAIQLWRRDTFVFTPWSSTSEISEVR